MRSIFLAAALLGATSAAAQGNLRDEAEISEGLIATGMAVRIAERCDSLDARRIQGINFLFGLKERAREMGYSESQINAYLEDKAEERRLIAVAEGRLADKGAVEGQPETFCTVGRAEMAAGTQTGRLLR